MSELRRGRNGRWTPASLRDHYRHQIVQVVKADQHIVAYTILHKMAIDGGYGTVQMRAVAEGLELGITKGAK